jgi:undecaprenyl-diphosphatase
MTPIQSIILGFIQGTTEFLPISSSGHLVIIPFLLGWHFPEQEAFIFNVLVQLATLLAVIVYFWRDLLGIVRDFILGLWQKRPFSSLQARLGWYLILATIPAGLAGLAFKATIEKAFNSPQVIAGFLLITAALLLLAEKIGKRIYTIEKINWVDALFIGLFQVVALLPGVSRSGATITGGMLRDLERPAAARFAFLMSVPVMLVAGLLETLDLLAMPTSQQILLSFIPGFVAAAIVGYLSIHWLLGFIVRRPLYIFAIYCIGLSLITLLVSLI